MWKLLVWRCSVFLVCVACTYGYTQQRFDGYFNNLIIPSLGSAGKSLKQNITTDYADFTYKMTTRGRPSPRYVSQKLFRKPGNDTYMPSTRNYTAMFAFFGQLVALELIDTDDTTCPVELMTIPVPRCDPVFDKDCTGNQHLPYERIAYDKNTGQSPNVPRKQVNKATSYIDGSFVYGNSLLRALYLQENNSPKLASGDAWSKYPKKNDEGLPFVSNPDPVDHDIHDPYKFWKLGDKHSQENPALLSLSVLFFRWHNFLVDHVTGSKHQGYDEVFAKTRHWVIATLQNIIVYEWLPLLVGESLPAYNGYKSDIYPDVTTVFDGAALRYILTLIPAGIFQRDDRCHPLKSDQYDGIRLCNSFWRSQDILMLRENAVEETLMGLVTQIAEADDTYIVEDLQSRFYGPLHFSRHDLVSQTIMRGRDYGLPDYNTVRQQMGLGRVRNWHDINPWLNDTNPEILETLRDVYKNIDNIDVFVGGMLETTPTGPGELFKAIIIDQFTRIRDGDRFWFENTENRLFSRDEIERVRSTKLYDIITNATKVDYDGIQTDVFVFNKDGPCKKAEYLYENGRMEPCTPHKGFDYFAGSEATYIIIWVSFGLIPFLCLLVVFVLYKFKQWRYDRNVKIVQSSIKDTVGDQLGDLPEEDQEGSLSQHKGTEWLGKGDVRLVVLRIHPDCRLEVINLKGKTLRQINMLGQAHVHVVQSSNKNRNVVLIRVPKEYDLVLQLRNDSQKKTFVDLLTKAVDDCGGLVQLEEQKLKHIYSKAFTQKKRNQLLEKFFKIVFSEAFHMDYDPTLDQDEVEMRQATDILEIELTKEEFASALAMKPNTDFVENMFALMDTDHNGYISFREFLNAVVMLSKGSGQNKLQTLFKMFDHDGNGKLNKNELFKLFSSLLEMANSSLSKTDVENLVESICRQHGLDSSGDINFSLLEMANSSLSKTDVENLVESICRQHGLDSSGDINFDDFCTLLSPHMDKLWNAGLEWKGVKSFIPPGEERKKSAEARKRANNVQGGDKMNKNDSMSSMDSTDSSCNSSEKKKFVAIRETYTPLKARMTRVKHYVENNRQHIFYVVIFYGICVGLFAERFYHYTVEREHSGLRALMSYGISTTRGAAAAMSFCFSLLLLTMLRNTITFLRGTFLNLYCPFDSIVSFHKVVAWTALFFTVRILFALRVIRICKISLHIKETFLNLYCPFGSIVSFHKVVAWTALFFTALHVVGYGFNFYQLATQPTKYLCVFDTVVFRSDFLPGFNFWFFGNMTGFTGLLLVILICVIYVFATQTARRLVFNAFWLSHKLIVLMYVLTILHGASMVVQKPMFYIYFTIPAVLFTIDKVISLSRKGMEIAIVRAENLASDVTFIEFKRPPRFEYKSGQWIRIACVAQGRNEYHPFTLTSAPHEDTLSVHIRAVGPWTYNLRSIFDQDSLKQGPYPKLCIDGPYGAGQQDWYTYDVSVLVGAGIGVTPYASILKDFVHMTSIKSTYKIRCQKLYFIWVTGSQRHFEWLLDIMREVEDIDSKGMVSIDIFITKFFQNFDLRTAMLYICEEHFQKLSGGKSVFTGLKASTHFGRPHLTSMFKTVHKTHPMVRKVGVFSCGPQGLTKSVERACVESSRSCKALFKHHFENF